jgi:16S rRNA (guanine527-N7)-methyltransferase
MRGEGSLDELSAEFGLDRAQSDAVGRYVDFIAGWRDSNVTAVRGADDVARVLIGDALSLLDAPQLTDRVGERWVDLGAGAGLPGIPLAIALPKARLVLLEASAKKCVFLEAAVRAIGLDERADVVCRRSERHAARGEPGREAYAVVLARAVAPLHALVELAAPLLSLHGVLVACTTNRALGVEGGAADVVAAACGLGAGVVIPLPRSPLADGVALIYEKRAPTPERLPRREGMAVKRPLASTRAAPPARSASIEGRAKGGR